MTFCFPSKTGVPKVLTGLIAINVEVGLRQGGKRRYGGLVVIWQARVPRPFDKVAEVVFAGSLVTAKLVAHEKSLHLNGMIFVGVAQYRNSVRRVSVLGMQGIIAFGFVKRGQFRIVDLENGPPNIVTRGYGGISRATFVRDGMMGEFEFAPGELCFVSESCRWAPLPEPIFIHIRAIREIEHGLSPVMYM